MVPEEINLLQIRKCILSLGNPVVLCPLQEVVCVSISVDLPVTFRSGCLLPLPTVHRRVLHRGEVRICQLRPGQAQCISQHHGEVVFHLCVVDLSFHGGVNDARHVESYLVKTDGCPPSVCLVVIQCLLIGEGFSVVIWASFTCVAELNTDVFRVSCRKKLWLVVVAGVRPPREWLLRTVL